MISDSIKSVSTGSLSFGIEKDESIKSILVFLRESFQSFVTDNELNITNEKGISQILCIFLNRKAKYQPYFFHSEYIEDINSGASPQVDIGIIAENEQITISDKTYIGNESFFSIEAKRLPTPGNEREKEYVIGKKKPCGGIERFKKGIHGKRINHAAIVGYIQKEDFNFWFLAINSWISELASNNHEGIWKEEDKISGYTMNNKIYAELNSKHLRLIDDLPSSYIHLYHFWLNFVK